MAADVEPRPEFAAALREWFVDEMGRSTADGADLDAPTLPAALEPTDHDDGDHGRSRRRWLLLLNAAAVVSVVVGLVWVGTRSDEPVTDPPAVSPPAPVTDPIAVAGEVCEQFRADFPRLAMGASPDEIERVANDVRDRSAAAATRLADAGGAAQLSEASRLIDEAADAAERLSAVAGGEREAVDSAVANLDLILTAWSRELADVAGEACAGLPTLREVF